MDLNQLNTIGTGMAFPIQLIQLKDSEGNPLKVPKLEFKEDGSYSPIMEEKKDKNGNIIYLKEPVYNEVGELIEPGEPMMVPVMVEAVSCHPISSQELIKQNLTSIMVFMLGQKFRQENFGCRIWECLEEPNTQALNFLIRDFVKQSIASWEPRITAIGTTIISKGSTLSITLRYKLGDSPISELTFDYNLLDNTSYAY